MELVLTDNFFGKEGSWVEDWYLLWAFSRYWLISLVVVKGRELEDLKKPSGPRSQCQFVPE